MVSLQKLAQICTILMRQLIYNSSQVKDRDYAHNAHSEPKLARFALVFCGEKSQRRLARVELADIITRPSPDSSSGRVSV